MNFLEIVLPNRASEIPRAHEALDQFARRHALPPERFTRLHVALEEHLTNIVSYGYEPHQAGTIRIRFVLNSSTVTVEIEDDARPFDPVQAREVDVSVPLEDKPIGGLGVLLIRKSVDALNYQRVGDKNILTLTTHLNSRRSG